MSRRVLISVIVALTCCVSRPTLGMQSAPPYTGPGAGMATWTGKLEKNQTLTIADGTPSTGVLNGAGLPGVPVHLIIDQSNLAIAEMPNASNSYRRLVLKSHGKHSKIVIHWTVISH